MCTSLLTLKEGFEGQASGSNIEVRVCDEKAQIICWFQSHVLLVAWLAVKG
jgi:hypothetical protein